MRAAREDLFRDGLLELIPTPTLTLTLTLTPTPTPTLTLTPTLTQAPALEGRPSTCESSEPEAHERDEGTPVTGYRGTVKPFV